MKHLSVLMLLIVFLSFPACATPSESTAVSQLSESMMESGSETPAESGTESSGTASESSEETTKLCQFGSIQFSVPRYCNSYRSTSTEGYEMLYLYMRNQRAIVQATPYPYANDIAEVNGEAMKQLGNNFFEGVDYQINSWKMETIGDNTFLVLNYSYIPSHLDYNGYLIIVDQQMYAFMGFVFDASGLEENQEFIYGMLETLAEAP